MSLSSRGRGKVIPRNAALLRHDNLKAAALAPLTEASPPGAGLLEEARAGEAGPLRLAAPAAKASPPPPPPPPLLPPHVPAPSAPHLLDAVSEVDREAGARPGDPLPRFDAKHLTEGGARRLPKLVCDKPPHWLLAAGHLRAGRPTLLRRAGLLRPGHSSGLGGRANMGDGLADKVKRPTSARGAGERGDPVTPLVALRRKVFASFPSSLASPPLPQWTLEYIAAASTPPPACATREGTSAAAATDGDEALSEGALSLSDDEEEGGGAQKPPPEVCARAQLSRGG